MVGTEPELSTATGLTNEDKLAPEDPQILQEILIEELSIDGICGVY
jgi:mycofactocin precursor